MTRSRTSLSIPGPSNKKTTVFSARKTLCRRKPARSIPYGAPCARIAPARSREPGLSVATTATRSFAHLYSTLVYARPRREDPSSDGSGLLGDVRTCRHCVVLRCPRPANKCPRSPLGAPAACRGARPALSAHRDESRGWRAHSFFSLSDEPGASAGNLEPLITWSVIDSDRVLLESLLVYRRA